MSFPHRFEESRAFRPEDDAAQRDRARWRWLFDTRHADAASFALVREAVLALGLGRDDSPDLLAIAMKTTDRVGHDNGPRGLEQFDVLWRLDRELQLLFELLD